MLVNNFDRLQINKLDFISQKLSGQLGRLDLLKHLVIEPDVVWDCLYNL